MVLEERKSLLQPVRGLAEGYCTTVLYLRSAAKEAWSPIELILSNQGRYSKNVGRYPAN